MCVSIAENIEEALLICPLSCAIVDQEEEYSEHLGQVLYDLGFEVSLFDDKEEFELKHCDNKFDIVILSWEPDWFGEEIVKAIEKCGEIYPSIVIGCDGGTSLSFQLNLKLAGFLFKPFDLNRLLEVMQRAMENKI